MKLKRFYKTLLGQCCPCLSPLLSTQLGAMFLGIFQYDGQSAAYSDALDYLNMIFTGVFTIEFILKLMAFRFRVNLLTLT